MLKSWSTFQTFINHANSNCNWIVLRNFEFLPNNFYGNDKDVDILCEDLNCFRTTMGLAKRSWGISSYQALIGNNLVPFDVRFLGDNYYDQIWQYKMLQSKIFTPLSVPRPSSENYFFSLLYHMLLQKPKISNIYRQRLISLYSSISAASLMNNIDDSQLMSMLSDFMARNHYLFCRPHDINVYQNRININSLPYKILHNVDLVGPGPYKLFKYVYLGRILKKLSSLNPFFKA